MTERFAGIQRRVKQGCQALFPGRIPDDRDAILNDQLTEPQAKAFRQLPAFDQTHLLTVYKRLKQRGTMNSDLLTAGLLHDLGKSDEFGGVRLFDRVVRVVLRTFAPRLLAHFARPSGSHIFHRLSLCVHHPRLGADQARQLGCSERTAWLIAHHEETNAPFDPDLALLQLADRE